MMLSILIIFKVMLKVFKSFLHLNRLITLNKLFKDTDNVYLL